MAGGGLSGSVAGEACGADGDHALNTGDKHRQGAVLTLGIVWGAASERSVQTSPPAPNLGLVGEGAGVRGPRRRCDHRDRVEGHDLRGHRAADLGAITKLAVVVGSPAPELAALGDGAGVVIARDKLRQPRG